MQLFRALVGSLLLVVAGCGTGTETRAAATRVLDANSAALSVMPVCFVPPSAQLGLTERTQQGQIVQICQGAAQSQGVPVVAWGSGQCLAASMSWAERDTGDRSADCSRTWGGGAECYSTAVRVKSIRVALAQPDGKVLAETTASIRSSRVEFTRESFNALCSAAFHDFPHPLANEQFDIRLE